MAQTYELLVKPHSKGSSLLHTVQEWAARLDLFDRQRLVDEELRRRDVPTSKGSLVLMRIHEEESAIRYHQSSATGCSLADIDLVGGVAPQEIDVLASAVRDCPWMNVKRHFPRQKIILDRDLRQEIPRAVGAISLTNRFSGA